MPRVTDPKCQHSTRTAIGSALVSSHKNLRDATGRMASVRVCARPGCVDDAVEWLQVQGFTAYVDGVKV